MKKFSFFFAAINFLFLFSCKPKISASNEVFIKDNYTKKEYMIAMRDGIKLYTVVYIPNDTATDYPFLICRTPYSCMPYGSDEYKKRLGPNSLFIKEKYIFVYQDVRGRHNSEGQFQEMTPAIDIKKSNNEIDESSDTYDTVDWLLKNINHNNGNAGLYGISYPGFYATASLPNAHPAIKAVSPQAPVTDEFEGDDANHRGAFFLMDNFSFMNFFDAPRTTPREEDPPINENIKIEDVYDFYLKTGALKNFNELYFKGQSKIWNEYLQHNSNDAYWQARNIKPHLVNIKPATLVVGGWFDAEDLFGALNTYKAIETQNPSNKNQLIMGPWTHGSWEDSNWKSFAGIDFGSNTSQYFQQKEFDFFNYYLKGKGNADTTEATIFITGSNEWKTFNQWPAKTALKQFWLNENHQLLLQKSATNGSDVYISDPANPVPYIDKKSDDRINEYMAADQSFTAKRNDVLYYESQTLDSNMILLGPITANLFASTSGTDADFIVKLIDVLPNGTQQLVRAEVLRGKFRNSWEKPEPFVPNQPTPIHFTLNDIAHNFLKGHKLMVQVQSSWFPLVDRNPQQFMEIPLANDSDFKKATIKIYHDVAHPSYLEVGEWKMMPHP